jgi:hypothetical protein
VASLTVQRSVLLAPDSVARAAARYAPGVEERWMLTQPRPVRRSYARHVLGAAHPHAQEIWMLRQPDAVRESYVREVLEAGGV